MNFRSAGVILRGGTPGQTYKVVLSVATTEGQIFQRCFEVKIIEEGC
jgi:hypothetical protein